MSEKTFPKKQRKARRSSRSSDLRIASVEYAKPTIDKSVLSSAQLAALWRLLNSPAPASPSGVTDENTQAGGVDDDSA